MGLNEFRDVSSVRLNVNIGMLTCSQFPDIFKEGEGICAILRI